MQSKLAMHRRKKCLAKTRKSSLCQAPAMPNGRCRMHGGKSTGAKGNKNALKHGNYTAYALVERQIMRELIRECRTLAGDII